MILFCRDEISARPSGTDLTFDNLGKSVFIRARRDRFPSGICLQKPVDFHSFKNIDSLMNFYKDICLLFFTD